MYIHMLTLFIKVIIAQLCTTITSQMIGTRIINGKPATFNTTKHQVSIRLKSKDIKFGEGHICGGSLIGPKTVLTAAHCLYDYSKKRFHNPRDFVVVMGTLNRFERTNSTVVSEVTNFDYMNSFNMEDLKDDIATMHLKNAVTANPTNTNIQTINLNSQKIKVNTTCQITGWGKTEFYNLSTVLLIANVTINETNSCKLAYKPTPIFDGMFCAANIQNSSDSCQGDSGGPLVCHNQLTGIVSWGNNCADPKYPGVYTDVQYYYKWIMKHNHSVRNATNLLLIAFILMIIYYT